MKNSIFLFLFALCFFLIVHCTLAIDNCLSQVTQEWVARYNGPVNASDGAHSLAVDGSGNVYVTGRSDADYATIKYNLSGVQQWVSRYYATGNYTAALLSIAVDGSGNVYVTGEISGGTGYDYFTIKYNSSGVQQWVARYTGPGSGNDEAHSIAVDGSGNVYVTGESAGSGTGADYATIKYNSSGVQQWEARYNGPGNSGDYATSIAVDGSGNVYVTGDSYESGTDADCATIKYNSSGVQQWVSRYNGPGNGGDYASSLAVDGSGNVYVTGESYGGSGTAWDYATIKYNSSGVQQWVARYNGPGNVNDAGTSLAVDSSGNVYVTGWSGGSGTSWDYATIKYNSSGVQQWVARYNGPANGGDGAGSLAVDGSGNVYVTGDSEGSGTGYRDYATLKYNSLGIQQWVQRYNGPGNGEDGASSLAVDGSGNVYVTGGSEGNGTAIDYATIKYSQLVGIQPVSNEIPDEFKLEQNYPNPFNPTTVINFQLPPSNSGFNYVRLIVYDVLGREVTVLVNEELKAGTYEVNWDATNVPSGVYFYKLNAGDFTETKKMMLVK